MLVTLVFTAKWDFAIRPKDYNIYSIGKIVDALDAAHGETDLETIALRSPLD